MGKRIVFFFFIIGTMYIYKNVFYTITIARSNETSRASHSLTGDRASVKVIVFVTL